MKNNQSMVTKFLKIILVVLFSATASHASLESQAKVQAGRTLLFNNGNYTTPNLVAAKTLFQQAVALDGTDQAARFFLSTTRLPALVNNTATYTVGPPIENVKELLDSIGMSNTGREIFNWTAKVPKDGSGHFVFSANIQALVSYQNFINSVILPEIDNAISDLSNIQNTFNLMLKIAETKKSYEIECDYGDILLYKSYLYSLKTFLLVVSSYNIDITNVKSILDKIERKTLDVNSDMLNNNHDLLNLLGNSPSTLLAAKNNLILAIDTYNQASSFIRSEKDDQFNDLVKLDPSKVDAENKFRANINKVKYSLVNKEGVEIGSDPILINFSVFFIDAINIRPYLPVFNHDPYTNKVTTDLCTITDRTFSGILPNALPDCIPSSGDLDNNGTVDLKDALSALKITSGLNKKVNSSADTNKDGKIGLEEAVKILQTIKAKK